MGFNSAFKGLILKQMVNIVTAVL